MPTRNDIAATRGRCVRLAAAAAAILCAVGAMLSAAGTAHAAPPVYTPVAGSPFGQGSETAAAFSPDGRLLATAFFDQGVAMYSVSSTGTLTRVPGSPFTEPGPRRSRDGLAMRPDGGLIATSNPLDDSMSLFTVAPSGALAPVPGSPVAVGDEPAGVAFSADGRLLAVANFGSGTVSIFSVSLVGAVAEVPGSPYPIADPASVAFSRTGLLAVANYLEGTISMYAVSAGGSLTAVPGSPFGARAGGGTPGSSPLGPLQAVAFDASGARLGLAGGSSLSVFAVAPTGGLSELSGSPAFAGANASAVAFGADGLVAAAVHVALVGPGGAATCGPIALFSIAAGDVQTLPERLSTCGTTFDGGHPDAVAFDPSGDLLAVGSFMFAAVPTAVAAQRPSIAGTPKLGSRLTCVSGGWTNDPTAFAWQWRRNDTPIIGASSATYTVAKIDEGNVLTCVQAASNGVGRGLAASPGVEVDVERVARCPRATGRASATGLGPLKLGLTRRQARRALRHSAVAATRQTDRFCLTPFGITAGYPSSKLLATLGPKRRAALHGRVVWMTTANAAYDLNGIRVGSTTAAAQSALHPGAALRIGATDWYVASYGRATAILAARRGAIRRIGLASRALTGSRAAQRRLLVAVG